MIDETYIAGGRKLDELLRTLPAKLSKNIMRAALRAGAVKYREAAKPKIPIRYGPLKKSLRVTTSTKNGVLRASLKVGNKQAWYGHFVEFGTQPHKIKAPKGHALKFGQTVVQEIEHPGSVAQPFMRPAADESHAAATAAVAGKLRERLTLAGLDVPAPDDVV